MKKGQGIISIVVLSFLLLFAIGTPLANSAGGTTWDYVVNPKVLDFDRYSGSGILYNSVGELRKAYDLNPLYAAGHDGSGQTVVIVDAYGSPTIYNDLLLFIAWQNARAELTYKLPWTTMADVQSHLHIYYPLGKPTWNVNPNDRGARDRLIGWSEETTLDVCMVHAIAPGADIALVIAPGSGGDTLNLCVNYAITNHLGCSISQSFGMPEYLLHGNNGQMNQAHDNYVLAASYGITVFASTGDWGATNGGPYNNALFPASDPYVTGVGGTNLFMYTTKPGYTEGTGMWINRVGSVGTSYFYEIAGNDYEGMLADGHPAPSDIVTTGGAMSSLFPLPSWQSGITLTDMSGATVTPTGRCTSDVAFDSGVYGGLGAVPYTAYPPYAGYYIIGGTSAGSPFWAALTAIACQVAGHNLGYINPSLYAFYFGGNAYVSGAFHDITMGDNTFPYGGAIAGYKATTGWDAPTGVGSLDAALLVPIMATW